MNLSTILADAWPDDFHLLKDSLPPWTIIVCVSGYKRRPEERIAIQEKYLQDICNELGLQATRELPGAAGREEKIRTLLSTAWNSEPYWKLRRKGSCHDVFFLSQLTKVHDYIRIMEEVIGKYKYPLEDPGVYIQPMVQGRGCHCEFNLPFNVDDDQEKSKIRKIDMEVSKALMDNGAFFSRPYGPWADMVYRHYPEGVSALRKLKGIFDPNNILNPGKLCF